MIPTEEEILDEIRRCAAANGGQPLGRNRFERQTGIPESAWAGRYWVSWGEAVRAAGFEPNELQGKYDDAEVLAALAGLVRRLGKFPVENELRMERRQDKSFPSHGTIQRLGNKAERARLLIDYCEETGDLADVIDLASPVAASASSRDGDGEVDTGIDGYVYLMKSGKHYKIGHTNAPGRREYELAIQLPERLTPKGCSRRWMNEKSDERGSSGVNILWPDTSNQDFLAALVAAEAGNGANNISPVVRYSYEGGGSAFWAGDLETDYMTQIEDEVELNETTIVFAPHHGRSSGRLPTTWLEAMQPKVVIIGEAKSEHLDYYGVYDTITQNSAGDITFDFDDNKVHIYVSSPTYSVSFLVNEGLADSTGQYYLGTLEA